MLGTALGAEKKLSIKLTTLPKLLLSWSLQYDVMLHASCLFLVTNSTLPK